MVFYSLEDKNRMFEGGSYFYNSVGLYLTFWKERFNPDKEDLSIALVWLRLYSLPCELWRPEILTDIGNTLGVFVKVVDQTRRMRYVSYAHICVYLDISKDLPTSIKLSWHDEDWIQDIDYEHIPFCCRRCHEHGHLFRECPQNRPPPASQATAKEKDAEGFEKVGSRQWSNKKHAKTNNPAKTQPINRYEVLNSIIEEGEGSDRQDIPADTPHGEPQKEIKDRKPSPTKPQGPLGQDRENEEMDLGEPDLDGIEKACDNLSEGYIPAEQITLLQEAIVKTKGVRGLGVVFEPMKGGEGKKRGQCPNAQRIRDAGGKLVASGQYPTIVEAFKTLHKVNP